MTTNTLTNQQERNWEGVIQNLYDSGVYDGKNDIKTDGEKVKVVVDMVQSLLSQQRDETKRILHEVRFTVELQAAERYYEDNSIQAKIGRIQEKITDLLEQMEGAK